MSANDGHCVIARASAWSHSPKFQVSDSEPTVDAKPVKASEATRLPQGQPPRSGIVLPTEEGIIGTTGTKYSCTALA